MQYNVYTLFYLILFLNGVIAAQSTTSEAESKVYLQYNPYYDFGIVDIEPDNKAVHLSLAPAIEAGDPLTGNSTPTVSAASTDNSKWINYSSWLLSLQSTKHKITAHLTATVPGVDIMVQAGNPVGTLGAGVGVSTGIVKLTAFRADVITGIGYAVTGNGINHGHNLVYSLAISDISKLSQFTTKTVTVVYTFMNE